MTAAQIKDGYAFTLAASEQHGTMLKQLVSAINYCTADDRPKVLTQTGSAGLDRLKELFSGDFTVRMVFAKQPVCDADAVADTLMTIWATMFFYPQLSRERFLACAEAIVLLDDLMAGGWFA